MWLMLMKYSNSRYFINMSFCLDVKNNIFGNVTEQLYKLLKK